MRFTADGIEIVPGPDGTPLFYRSRVFPNWIQGSAWWDGHCVYVTVRINQGLGGCCHVVEPSWAVPDLSPEECYSTQAAAEQAIEADPNLLL